MITKDNFKSLLLHLNFQQHGNILSKTINNTRLAVDFDKQELHYPENQGLKINERQTCNFSAQENFVVFECVHRLIEKGYTPDTIELEPKWKLGHGASGGRADILVKDRESNPLLIIECKTACKEFDKAWKATELDGDQLFSYAQQIPATQFLCLYTSDYTDELNYISHIISHRDNEKILNDDNTLKSFKQAENVKERYAVWRNTYKLEFTRKGIFEANIAPYTIGKDKYQLSDLNSINKQDKEGKYHEFRTILRKYSVARRENAFEVLVNLFLCKIVDETENAHDLKFYWKGIAYDNYFDLVDRLQSLYKTGMERFLNQDIIYVSNEKIDEAFWAVKNDRNATKKAIKEIFRQLKFYKGLDFDFIPVQNKIKFEKNAKVLIEVVQMWQDLRLKTHEKNQFLGDMFEYFLDNGIKQSEGQFFTPMPICRFILMSLPLEQLIKDSQYPPKAIDYACGAGHFLNEYAAQIKPFVQQYKQQSIKDFYQQIVGIEKEDRLAKVAKVSAFMYGQDEINIIDADALSELPELHDFNILVANPPFAVEGFLETLEEKDRENYQLFNTVSDVANNRNIQCFFIERAKQLLAPNGIAAIIVPSSVLSNSDITHIGAREILLQYFDIVALVELGSGTFGKTGTNTVVLFLRRKHKQPTEAEQYQNRVADWFDGLKHDEARDIYQDEYIIKQYCQHLGFEFEAYKTLLSGEPNQDLLAHELFVEYHAAFNKSTDANNLLSKHQKQRDNLAKNLKAEIIKQHGNKIPKLTAKEISEKLNELLPLEHTKLLANQELERRAKFLAFMQGIEKDKLFYFALAYHNPQNVLIVKSPTDNKEQKTFLGYEWSSAKGNEGIKLITDSEGNHTQPLYDAKNRNNPEKINYLIAQNFLGQALNFSDNENLNGLVSTARLIDMLDFSRVDFNKAISLTAKKSVMIETRWDLVKLGDIAEIIAGQSPSSENYNEVETGFAFYQGKKDFGKIYLNKPTVWTTQLTKKSVVNDLLISVRAPVGDVNLNPYNEICIGRGLAAIRSNDLNLQKYLFEFISLHQFLFQGNRGTTFDSISTDDLRQIKIPLPPKEIQQKIVDECTAIDNEVSKASSEIEHTKIKIEEIISEVSAPLKKLSEITLKIGSGATPKGGESSYKETGIALIRSQNIYDDYFKEEGLAFIDDEQAKLLENVTVAPNDILFNITGASVARCNMVNNKYLPARVNQHVAIIRPNNQIEAKYLHRILISSSVKASLLRIASGSSTREAITKSQLEEFKIPVPDLDIQKNLVSEIEQLENKIAKARLIIDESASKKQAILKKYL